MEKKQNELARAFKLWRCSVPHRIIYVSLIPLAIMANRNFGNVLVEQLGIGYNLSVILPIISCFISYIILRLLSYVARKLPVEEEMIRHYTMK